MNNKSIQKPDWFNLDLYSFLSKGRTQDWFLTLVFRHAAWGHMLNNDREALRKISSGLYRTLCLGNADTSNKDNIPLPDYGEPLSEQEEETLKKEIIEKGYLSALMLAPLFDPSVVELDSDHKPSTPIPQYRSRDSWKNLAVDMSSSDFVIIEEFESWLKEQRKQQPLVKQTSAGKVTSSKIRDWFTSNMLPYMDLKLYFYENQIESKDTEIIELIFGDKEGASDKMKVIKRHINETQDLATSLKKQVHLEKFN